MLPTKCALGNFKGSYEYDQPESLIAVITG